MKTDFITFDLIIDDYAAKLDPQYVSINNSPESELVTKMK